MQRMMMTGTFLPWTLTIMLLLVLAATLGQFGLLPD